MLYEVLNNVKAMLHLMVVKIKCIPSIRKIRQASDPLANFKT